jgi:lipopolysaccharide/colanic/teichoic acid biosynthesis glycosyltransferase
MKKWEDLPIDMQVEEIKPYYEYLKRKKLSLFIKRLFDIIVSALMLVILSPLIFTIAIAIKISSPGPVFFRQVRVTQYKKQFRIFKFRSMVYDAENKGPKITIENDSRITKIGYFIRRYRLDEIAQLIDVFRGTMTFVGVRPELVKYIEYYTPEMMATFLLPAGVTNLASIYYKDENKFLVDKENAEKTYILTVLPNKMKWNLQCIMEFSFLRDIKIMFMTFWAVFGDNF